MSDSVIRLETRPGVAVLTLNRPEKRNALNAVLISELLEALDRLASDASVRVLVLTGAGRVFSAGADLEALRQLQHASLDENRRDSLHLARLFERIYTFPKPVIAQLNGHAIGGGIGLAMACDFVVAASSARIGFTEVRVGFVPALVGPFLTRRVGDVQARNLLLRGHLITADEAATIGLITQVVADDQLESTVEALARELATEPSPTALRLTKEWLSTAHGLDVFSALRGGAAVNALARGTPDCREGVQAFLDKRDPDWKRNGPTDS